jgi:hypothetical protein
MKRFFGKRRATRFTLGELTTQPFGRLGALVFQFNNSDKLYWASLRAPTRIAGCALSLWPDCHRLEKRCLRKRRSPLAENPSQSNGGCADTSTISFSLCAVFAEQDQRTPGGSNQPLPGADASAIHGRTERSGCTAAEPYPLSCDRQDTGSATSQPDKHKRIMD